MIAIFDNKQNTLNPNVINGKGEHTSYFDVVSTGLYQEKQFFILDNGSGHENRTLDIRAELSETDYIRFFDININNNTFELKQKRSVVVNKTKSTPNYTIYSVNVALYSQSPIQSAYSKLVISEPNQGLNATIHLYGDVEGEIDKYKVALQNIGVNFDERWIAAFKESNIKEDQPDYIILNQKRAEFLEATTQMIDFNSTYYGLINAIKFFGYDDDVFIKEFWKNVNNVGQEVYTMRGIEGKDLPDLSKFTRTNMFALTYRLNDFADKFDVGGQYDQDGVPNLIDIFKNQAEAIFKIHNMRLLIEEFFIPAHAIIVDIIGEEIVLNGLNENVWLHKASVDYRSDSLPKYKFEFEVDEIISDRFVKLYDLRNAGDDNIEDQAYRIKGGFVDTSADFTAVEGVKEFYRDNIALVQYKLISDDISPLVAAITEVRSRIVNVETQDVVVSYNHYDNLDQLRLHRYAITDVGTFQLQIQYIDTTGNIHTDYTEFTTILTMADFEMFRVAYPPEDGERNEFDTFEEIKEFIYGDNSSISRDIKYDYIKLNSPYHTLSTNDLVRYGIIQFGEDPAHMNAFNNSAYNIDRYVRVLAQDECEIIHPTVSELRRYKIYNVRGLPVMTSAKYMEIRFMFDQWDKGEAIDWGLGYYGQDYETYHLDDFHTFTYTNEREYLAQIVDWVSSRTSGIWSKFTATLEDFVPDQATPNTIVHSIVLTSKEPTSPTLYKIQEDFPHGSEIMIHKVQQFGDMYSWLRGEVFNSVTDEPITLKIGAEVYTTNLDVTDATELVTWINGLGLDDINAFILEDSNNKGFFIISRKDISINHASFGILNNIYRPSTIRNLLYERVGGDIEGGSLMIFTPKIDNYVYRPHDIKWKFHLFNSETGEYELIRESICPSVSMYMLDNGWYSVELEYTDSKGNVTSNIKNGVLIVK